MDKVLTRISKAVEELNNIPQMTVGDRERIKNRFSVLASKYKTESSLHNISMINALCNEVKLLSSRQ